MLSEKARRSLEAVVNKFREGDISPLVEVVKVMADIPARKWTFSNRVLAFSQTGTIDCRGYRQWQEVGRHVIKGAEAAYILAPIHKTVVKVDEEMGEEKVEMVLVGFKGVPVFPVYMTDGKPLDYQVQPRQLPPLFNVAQRLGVQVKWDLTAGSYGAFSQSQKEIVLGTHDPYVYFHELAHAAHSQLEELKEGQDPLQEIVAELTACTLMHMYGLGDRTGNAWRYIEHYAKDPVVAITKALDKVGKVLDIIFGEEKKDEASIAVPDLALAA
jgi:hypothetical protein